MNPEIRRRNNPFQFSKHLLLPEWHCTPLVIMWKILGKFLEPSYAWLLEAKQLWRNTPLPVRFTLAVVQVGIVPLLGGVLYGPHSLDSCAAEMANIIDPPPLGLSFSSIPDRLRYEVLRRWGGYGEWERETAHLVARLISNRHRGKEALSDAEASGKMTPGDAIHAVQAKSSSFGLQDAAAKTWQDNWNAVFDVLTGSMLIADRVPLWKVNAASKGDGKADKGKGLGKGQLMLAMWNQSWHALHNATSASYADITQQKRTHKNFEHLFRKTAEYATKRFEHISSLRLDSISETEFIDSKALSRIIEVTGIDRYNYPGNAMSMWPMNYGLSVSRSVDMAICLPAGYSDCRDLTSREPQRYTFKQHVSNLIMRDLLPLHRSKRESSEKENWNAASKRLLIYVPLTEVQQTGSSGWGGWFSKTAMTKQDYCAKFKDELVAEHSHLANWDVKFVVYTAIYLHRFPSNAYTYTIIDSRFLAQRTHRSGVTGGFHFTLLETEVYPLTVHFNQEWEESVVPVAMDKGSS